MGFLTPFFLAGLACLALPVLLHLTRRERGKPVRFPSLMFLQRLPFQEKSRRRIRHWALLALRLAALALLAAAFARPFARSGGLVGMSGAGPEEVVVLLDRSYSMGFGDHWEQAAARAREATDGLGLMDRVSLVAFSETPHLLVRSSADRAPVLAALDTLETSSLGTRIASALKLAGSVLEASPLAGRRVVLISDFQQAGWQPDRDAALPEGTQLELEAVGGEGAGTDSDNLALTGLELRREPGPDRERVSVRIRIVAFGSRDQEAKVTLSVDGTDVETVAVAVPAGGSASASLGPFMLAHAFTRGEVRLANDELAADNVVHFVASPKSGPQVLVWDARGAGESNLHLRGALEIGAVSGFATRVTATTPSAAQLDEADVVVLNGVPVPEGPAGRRLRDFVENGGGLLVALGDRRPFAGDGDDFLPVTAGRLADAAGEPRRLGFVDYDHPIFEAFREPRAGDFSRTAFYRTREVEARGGRTLARFDDASPALVEGRLGRGRILVWAGGLGRLWSDFPLQAVYLPFLHRVSRYLGIRGESSAWRRAGATVDLALLAEAAGVGDLPAGVVAMAPGGGGTPVDPETPLLFLAQQGIWEIRPPGRRPDHPMAVAANVDVAESDLARLDLEEFVVAAGADRAPSSGTGAPGRFADGGPKEDIERRQGFWRVLLAGAFLVMASESILANRMSRRRSP